MAFKSGRLAEVLLGAIDLSPYLYSAEFNAYVNTAEVSTFKSSWKSHISGEAFAQFFTYGYFDTSLTTVRAQLQATPGVVSYAPAGATTIGDNVRLLTFNTVDYKEQSRINNAVLFTWQADTTLPAGIGVSLHPLASENVGTINGTGDGVITSLASTTGAIAHLHVTAMTGGDTQNFKLQDATTQGGAYTDIASGAFTAVTAVGSQRLVIPGTIRQYVRCVATIAGHACTYSVSVART